MRSFFVNHRFPVFAIAVIAAVSLVIYAQSLQNGFVIWDDDSLVYENPLVQELSLRTLKGIFTSYDPELYIPFTLLSFQVEHALFGFAPFFYHLTNLLLHIVAGGLVFLFLRQLRISAWIAFGCALLFAVHPINTEAVAWVSARKDLLASVFSLGALVLYQRYLLQRRMIFFYGTLLLFLLALLSKASAIMLPAMFLLLDWFERRKDRCVLTEKIPFFLLSAVFLGIALAGKARNIESLTLIETLLLAAKSAAFSVKMFLFPAGISVIYQQSGPITIADSSFFVSLMTVLTLGVFIALSLRRTRTIAFSFLFFLLAFAPSFANFSKADAVYYFSDRYIYLAQIGLLFLLGQAIDHTLRRRGQVMRASVSTAFAVVIIIFGWTAHARSLVWAESVKLFTDALSANVQSAVMRGNLGLLYHRRGQAEAAEREYLQALEIDPRHWRTLTNLGFLYQEQGKRDAARELYGRALEANPRSEEAHVNVGTLLLDDGKADEAIAHFRSAIGINPSFAPAYANLASAYAKKQMYKEALDASLRALELDPSRKGELQE